MAVLMGTDENKEEDSKR